VPAIIIADRIAESPADVRLDGDQVTADPDDGDAGHPDENEYPHVLTLYLVTR
jgi:hypothetical protein